ncbi:MAG TPA: fumarylacetoacetate hydrolase family protein [Actinomycetota bacterium]|nr:fumarylacetoacetate hydrolase family protein [Actinomycetota bacterium]
MRLATLADGRPARIEADRCYPLPGTLVDHLCRAPASLRGKGLAFEDAVFGPPVRRPGKIICIGLNYLDHARETNAQPPEKPLLFSKPSSCVIGAGDAIEMPNGEVKLDYEAELAVVIGAPARAVSAEQAAAAIGGYACFNDVSERVAQLSDGQWFRGKSFDTFAPFGPWVVTPDDIPDPHDLGIRSLVNGEVRQDSSTSQLIFKVPALVSYCSHAFSLEPGDVIATGTPAGVALGTGAYLKPGDVVTVEIDGLGSLANEVVAI